MGLASQSIPGIFRKDTSEGALNFQLEWEPTTCHMDCFHEVLNPS